MGNKKEKLEQEEAEYLEVRSAYEDVLQTLEPMLEHKRIIDLLLKEYEAIDEDYENLLVRKENYLKFQESEHPPELDSIRTKLLPLRVQHRELEEAFDLSNAIAQKTASLRGQLIKIKHFGSVDEMR